MNWDAISAVAELAGAVAVFASLAYLAVQIRQNTKSSREATYQAIVGDLQQFRLLIAQDPQVSRLYRQGLMDMDSLSEEDRWRFGALMQTLYSVFEAQYRARRHEIFSQVLGDMEWIAGRPGARQWWKKAKRIFEPEFVLFIDEAIGDAPESDPD